MTTPSQIFALMVGIDQYPSPIPPLNGCVNDITAIEAYLQNRVAQDGYQLQLLTLKNQQATRQAVIDGFRQHLSQAGPDDVALFYYSGHGSQEQAPPEFWHLEPDRLDETIVCYDSRTEAGWDLADKELAKLISEVSQSNPHFVVILDCCHSGSGTRNALLQETGVRRLATDKRQRPLESFLVSPAETTSLSTSRSPEQNPSGWKLPQGRYVLMSACRDCEEAKEFYGDGQNRGAFSYFFMETLQKANGSLTYRDLFKRADAIVRSRISAQSPQLEATNLADLDQPFLGGAIALRPPYFTVSYNNQYGWVIDGGAVHGVQGPAANGETTLLALFPFDSPAEQMSQVAQALATAEVQTVLPQLSQIHLSNPAQLNPETTYKAVVTSLPLPPLTVALAGDPSALELLRQALHTVGPEGQASLYVREAAEAASANFRVLARNNEYLITRPADDRPLVAQVEGYTPANATKVVQRLEHIARWQAIASLASPADSRIPADAVQMEIEVQGQTQTATDLRLEYRLENGKWEQPTFRLKLRNSWTEPLYCALLDLTERFSVSADLLPGGGVWLQPKEETWALQGNPFYGSVPKELWQQGVTEYQDLLKLIVSTTAFDATLLQQEKLDLPATKSLTRGLGQPRGTLNRLMNRVTTRELSREPEDDEPCDDWVTSQVRFTTVRPQNATPLQSERSVTLGSGVTLEPHPSLKANARLTTVPQSTRDLGNDMLPPILRDNPAVVQPFQFTASRGSDPGLSVLELSNIENYQAVTPEAPLTVVADVPLAEGEHLLSVGYDGEFFIPLGVGRRRGNQTEIKLERLPDPVSIGKRSLGGAIRIFFQKVLSEKLGLPYEYPILAAVKVGPDETIQYEGRIDEVAKRVKPANKILLYIHGIIGDTRSMVGSVRRAKITLDGQEQLLADQYDLVLAFDYENLNTSIEENGRLLRQRLTAVGLGPNHGKTLHIVAHSMGGLVSRWFIEREGGGAEGMVQHLMMLGTPNAGSPWPTVQDFAFASLTFALNGLAAAAWPTSILGGLLAAIENIDTSLDQMKPGSDFLQSLAASPAPGISYSIVAGNTSIIQPPTQAQSNKLKALLQKVTKGAVELPFFGQANDIAVLVQSIKSIPGGRSPEPKIQEVACDHLVYFANLEGLRGLAWAVAKGFQPQAAVTTDSGSTPAALAGANSEVVTNDRPFEAAVANPTPQPEPTPDAVTPVTPVVSESSVHPEGGIDHTVSSDNNPNSRRGWMVMLALLAILLVGMMVVLSQQSQQPQPKGKPTTSFLIPRNQK